MTYPDSPQVAVGTRTLMIALTELEQSSQAGRLPGADDKGSEVRFSVLSREGVRQALAAVKHILGGG